jgi:excisionase family DNA binding protein
MNVPEDEKLLTFKEAYKYLRVSRNTLYRFMDEGRIEGHKVGRTWRFYLGELKRFVMSSSTQEKQVEIDQR